MEEGIQKDQQLKKIAILWFVGSIVSIVVVYVASALSKGYSPFSEISFRQFTEVRSVWLIVAASFMSCAVAVLGHWRYGNCRKVIEIVTVYGLGLTWLQSFVVFVDFSQMSLIYGFVFSQYGIAWVSAKILG
jgi:hypothetical protein